MKPIPTTNTFMMVNFPGGSIKSQQILENSGKNDIRKFEFVLILTEELKRPCFQP